MIKKVQMTLPKGGEITAIAVLVAFMLAQAILLPTPAWSRGQSKLVDSKAYKSKDFRRGIIADYSDMLKGDRIDWVWVSPSLKLSQYSVKVGGVANKSDSHSKAMVDDVRSILKSALGDLKGSKGTLNAEFCIYEVQGFSPGKAWIPYAGGHQMQAGIGIEMVLRDSGNKIVAKFRHFDRRGSEYKGAAQQVADRLVRYLSKH